MCLQSIFFHCQGKYGKSSVFQIFFIVFVIDKKNNVFHTEYKAYKSQSKKETKAC